MSLKEAKFEILDVLDGAAADPVPDLQKARLEVAEIFDRLEGITDGKEEG